MRDDKKKGGKSEKRKEGKKVQHTIFIFYLYRTPPHPPRTPPVPHPIHLDDAHGGLGVAQVVQIDAHHGQVVLGRLVRRRGLAVRPVCFPGLGVLQVQLGVCYPLERLACLWWWWWEGGKKIGR